MAKRARTVAPGAAAQPEDIFKGAIVIYDGVRRGIVKDAFAPLDQFWIADEQSNEMVRDAEGEIVAYSASQLVLAPPPEKLASSGGGGAAWVLIIGTEQQMLQILEQFGAPDASQRHDPQQLLAVPCSTIRCGPGCTRFDPCKRVMCNREDCPLLQLAADGIDEAMQTLARRLRPDIHVDVRAFHLKQAIEQVGPDLNKLEGYYCLSAVTLPFGQGEIGAASGWERYWMEEVRCQIDLGASADGPRESGENSLEDTAKRALGEACGMCLSDAIWSEDAQFQLRRKLGVDLPLKFWDGPEAKVFVLLLPDNAVASSEKGLLVFREAPGSSLGKAAQKRAGGDAADKSIAQWKEEQDQFKDLPKLPAGWIRIKSRSSGETYFWDTRANKPSFEFPLPEGWTKQKSKSTGKVYYFNAKKRKSSFEIPTE